MPRKLRKTAVKKLLNDIVADVNRLFPNPAPATNHLAGITGEDLYEAYLFMRVLSAAQRKGATIELRGEQTGKRAHDIRFRMSPGTLYHASKKAPDYTFARLTGTNPNSPVALFVGIKALGYSGVTHECDLLLLPRSTAAIAQKQPRYQFFARADLYVEAKFNSKRVPLPTARALIGVHADLGLGAVVLACHGDLDTNAKTYLSSGPWQWLRVWWMRPAATHLRFAPVQPAAGFGLVQPATPGHNLLEAHLETLLAPLL